MIFVSCSHAVIINARIQIQLVQTSEVPWDYTQEDKIRKFIPLPQLDQVSVELADDNCALLQPSFEKHIQNYKFLVPLFQWTNTETKNGLGLKKTEYVTIAISRCRVNLCCWPSTAAIAAAASLPSVAMFDFKSSSFVSEASSLAIVSGLPFVSLTLAWRLETSITCLGQKKQK
jgi:hypothetical protein